MITTTIAQERAMALAPVPFATLSLLSSGYVIHHLLCRRRDKLERMYHRLILALNFALVLLSAVGVWSPFAVPEGTPRQPFAAGTVRTCTAQGFIFSVCILASPVYYGSLSAQAYLAIKNNFREERYKWIEKWIHLAALGVPVAFSAIATANEGFNPSARGCALRKAPLGCETDPDIPCERGKGVELFQFILGLGSLLLYFVIPPTLTALMYCWIGRQQKRMEGSRGLQRIKESIRKQTMESVGRQISLYLVSFWSTWVVALIVNFYRIVSGGKVLYNLLIIASCLHASQGFVFAIVYFGLQRIGHVPRIDGGTRGASSRGRTELTVRRIRESAVSRGSRESEMIDQSEKSYDFNVFDGVPDEDSPWAKFIDPDSDDDGSNADTPSAGVTQTNDGAAEMTGESPMNAHAEPCKQIDSCDST